MEPANKDVFVIPPQQTPQVIVTQPTGKEDRTRYPGCPEGLEPLYHTEQLFVMRQPDMRASIFTVDKIQYDVVSESGVVLYRAKEESSYCGRNWCSTARAFQMKLFDNARNEMVVLTRPFNCQQCCFPCCLQSIEVAAPPGNLLGVFEEEFSVCHRHFRVRNAEGKVVLLIRCQCCSIKCASDVVYRLYATNGEEIGRLYKTYRSEQRFMDENVLGMEVPIDLDVTLKAVCLAGCILLDMMFHQFAINPRNAPKIR